jgi:hypothetical protein
MLSGCLAGSPGGGSGNISRLESPILSLFGVASLLRNGADCSTSRGFAILLSCLVLVLFGCFVVDMFCVVGRSGTGRRIARARSTLGVSCGPHSGAVDIIKLNVFCVCFFTYGHASATPVPFFRPSPPQHKKEPFDYSPTQPPYRPYLGLWMELEDD